ncbi:MAG: VOC family protein [Candidatus Dormibacteria bacterium]
MAVTGVHHVALTVRDQATSQAFYEGVLGFAPIAEIEEHGHRTVILKRPDAAVVIGLHQHRSNDGQRFSEFTTGMDHLAFEVDTREDLDSWERRLETAEVAHSPVTPGARPGSQILVFRDPDNIQLEFVHMAARP